MLSWLAKRTAAKQSASRLYGAIVAQSRLPAFYAAFGVPDTVTGRFEMIVLHLFLVLSRLKSFGAGGERLSQALSEAFIADMDGSIREMGVGDLTVPKQMQATASAYFGRLKAYENAIGAAAVPGALEAALARNLFADDDGPPRPAAVLTGLAAYVRASATGLEAQDLGSLAQGQPAFARLPRLA